MTAILLSLALMGQCHNGSCSAAPSTQVSVQQVSPVAMPVWAGSCQTTVQTTWTAPVCQPAPVAYHQTVIYKVKNKTKLFGGGCHSGFGLKRANRGGCG